MKILQSRSRRGEGRSNEASVIASTPLPPSQIACPQQLPFFFRQTTFPIHFLFLCHALRLNCLCCSLPYSLAGAGGRAQTSTAIHETTGIPHLWKTAPDGKTRPSSPPAIEHRFISAISFFGLGPTAIGYRNAVHAAILFAISPLPEIGSPTFQLLSLSIILSQP